MVPVTTGVPRAAPVCDPGYVRSRASGEIRAGRSPTPNLRRRSSRRGTDAIHAGRRHRRRSDGNKTKYTGKHRDTDKLPVPAMYNDLTVILACTSVLYARVYSINERKLPRAFKNRLAEQWRPKEKRMKAHAPTVTSRPVSVLPLAGITQITVYF